MSHFKDLKPSDVMKLKKTDAVKWVDLRFTDPRGKWQHLTMDIDVMTEDAFEEGIMFDGSSIAGWQAINESDMILRPDLSRTAFDPFSSYASLIVFCDIDDPGTGQAYHRDPRSTAKRAEEYLRFSGIGDTAYFGPEPEFFVFDDVRFEIGYGRAMYRIDDVEGPYNSATEYEEGNIGHRPLIKGGYFPVPPAETLGFENRQSRDPDIMQRLFHVIKLERLDDGFDLLHVRPLQYINGLFPPEVTQNPCQFAHSL